jgi:hypothetical protein
LIFRAELNDVRASVTQFPGHVAWVTPVQIGGVNKGIKLQLVKWFHASVTARMMTRCQHPFSPQVQNNGALSERGCVVLDQSQRLDRARRLRLVFDTAALR